MATIFGNISGYTFLGMTTLTGNATVPAGQFWVAFSFLGGAGGMLTTAQAGGGGLLSVSQPSVVLQFGTVANVNNL